MYDEGDDYFVVSMRDSVGIILWCLVISVVAVGAIFALTV